jgi:transposase
MLAETLVMCHEKAFLFFSGVPKTILYDNMKAVVVERDCYGKGKHKFHAQLFDLSKRCNFEIRLCKPYRAKTKGKVERFNSYLKGNFYRPIVIKLKDAGLLVTPQILNERSSKWLIKANNRIHGTTKKIPSQVFTQEEVHHLTSYMQPVTSKTETFIRSKQLPQTVVQKSDLLEYDKLLLEVLS